METAKSMTRDPLQKLINRMRRNKRPLTLGVVKGWWRQMELCLNNK